MTCRTRPAPQTTWTQEGGTSTPLQNPAGLDAIMWLRTGKTHLGTTNLIGRGEFAYSNAGGLATSGFGWIAALKRYGQWTDLPNAGAPGAAVFQMSPAPSVHDLVDPLLPVVPVIVRVRDVVQVVRSAGASYGSVGLTLGNGYIWQDGNLEALRSIGFHSYGGSTWRSYMSGNVIGVNLRAFDTGRLITDLVELMFEIDGSKKEVRYYIDGELVDTFVPPVDASVVVTNRTPQLYWTNRPNANVTMRYHHGLGIGTVVEVEALS